jgi:S-adenosylmethionine-dependent methyltransferase
MKTGAQTDNRFQSDAARYAAYLETPEGRLRLDLAFANLQEFLPDAKRPLRALDLGCGTGVTAIRLARMGIHVTLLDCSAAMLSIAERAVLESGVGERVALIHRDATQLENSFESASFDLILCHNVLEYVADPVVVLHGVARLLRDSSSILSVLLRNQAGESIKAAIQAGDLASAQDVLTSEWAQESLYGGRVRLFTPEKVRSMLQAQSFRVIAERGVRVIADYLPTLVRGKEEYERIFEFERRLGSRAGLAGAARYIHCLASPVPTEDRA